MILRVRDVEISSRIERHSPGIAELTRFQPWPTNDFDRLIFRVKNLDAAVAEFADVLPAGGIHANIVGIAQLALVSTWLAVRANKFSFARKNLNPMIAGISHINPVLGIHAQTFRPVE